jgi:hypothetical protein
LTPFFPRIHVHLVGLTNRIGQRQLVGGGPLGEALEASAQGQQVGAVAAQLAGQLGGGHPLGDAAEDEHQVPARPLGALQRGAGEGVEHPPAAAALVVEDGIAAAAVNAEAIGGPAVRTAEPVGVAEVQQAVVTGTLVEQIGDREVHLQSPAVGDRGVIPRRGRAADKDRGTDFAT